MSNFDISVTETGYTSTVSPPDVAAEARVALDRTVLRLDTEASTATLGVNDVFRETFCGGRGGEQEEEVSPASVLCTRAKEAGPGKGEGWGGCCREWWTTLSRRRCRR